MDELESEIIIKNLDKLIENTECNDTFLAILKASGILSKNDVTDLVDCNPPTRKVSQFYTLIQTRVGGYKMLMKALSDTNQTGALSILSKKTLLHYKFFFDYDETKRLGKGPFSTVIKGQYEHPDRDVAVKRIFRADEIENHRIETEIEILRLCEGHENIVQYFANESSIHFVLIIIELCDMTLREWVEVEGVKPILITPTDVLKQITCGLQWLHKKQVLYQGLIPENILLKADFKKIKISGFGLSTLLKNGETGCAVSTVSVAETIGWDAPEVTQAQKADDNDQDSVSTWVSFPSDIYSLGCMYYYVLTDGRHDFGDLKNLEVEDTLAENSGTGVKQILLIKQMILDNPESRPSCSDLVNNPVLLQRHEVLEQRDQISTEPHILTEIKKIKEQNEERTRNSAEPPIIRFLIKLNRQCEQINRTLRSSVKQLNVLTAIVLLVYLLYVTALLYRVIMPRQTDQLQHSLTNYLEQKPIDDSETLDQINIENDWNKMEPALILNDSDMEGKLFEMVLREDLVIIKRVFEAVAGKLENAEIVDRNERTLLHTAAQRGDYHIFEYLVNDHFGNILEKPVFEHTLIHDCILQIHVVESEAFDEICMIIKFLLAKRPELIESRDEYQNTLLHVATSREFKKQVEFITMILAHNADVNAKNIHGDTPLHLAVNSQVNLIEIIRVLIEHHADPDAVNAQGWTFLHKASECVSSDLFHKIVEYLVSIQRTESFNTVNSDGNTVLHYAVLSYGTKPETLEIFKAYGADYNAIDKHGNSVLFLAIRFGRTESFLNTLIRLGAAWEIINQKQETALHQAAYYNNLYALKLFISLNADVNARNVDGNTPLHKAVYSSYNSYDYHQIVVELLKNGADPNARNAQGKLPYHIVNERVVFGGIRIDTIHLLEVQSG